MDPSIELDLRKTVAENAESCYQKAKKAKEKLAGARKAKADTEKKIAELLAKHEKQALLQKTPVKKKPKEKKWYEKYHFFDSGDGFFVVCGKDATTNEILIKKHLEKDDLVFHADIHGAPFCVIKNPEKKEITDQAKAEAASAAASYSKAWKLGLGSCDVYHVSPEQVSKTPPSGEYLGKGAFMIYGKKEWFRGVPLELAIGLVQGEEPQIISGPVRSIESKTRDFVRIRPGDKKSEELAREIRKALEKKSPKTSISLEDIQRHIPGGKGRMAN